jgi:hypothetical protein
MANTAFNHDPALTVAASNTTAGAAVKWVASKNLGESLIILDSGGNGRIGLAGDLDLITLTANTVTVAGTVAATAYTGDGSSLTGISAGIASLAADTSPQLGGALDVNGQSIVSASNGDINIIPNGTGSIGLNTTGVSAYLVEIGGAFQGTIDESAGLYINPTITGAAGGSTYVARIKGTIVEAGSGTHPIAIGLAVNTPTITNAGAALTTSATFYVQGAPSGATTNYAVYVDGGTSRFDGDIQVQENTTLASVTKGIAKAWCKFNGTSSGPITNDQSYNCDATTDSGTGLYTVNFTTNFSSAHPAVVAGGNALHHVEHHAAAAGTYSVKGLNSSHAVEDAARMYLIAFGESS